MKDKISITLDADITKILKKIADDEQRTMSNLINLMLRKSLDEISKKNSKD